MIINNFQLTTTLPGAIATPADIPRNQPASAQPNHAQDVWYQAQLNVTGKHRIHFEGLATLAEVWLDDTLILTSNNMFLSHDVDVDIAAYATLTLCCRSLEAALAKPAKRPKWKPQMVKPASLAGIRTTLLGHMPGWCPPVQVIGPWRKITITPLTDIVFENVRVQPRYLGGGRAELTVSMQLNGTYKTAFISCAGQSIKLPASQTVLNLHGIDPWWPHTHGTPQLYDVVLHLDDKSFFLVQTGFCSFEMGKNLALKINGEPIFCRGACWMPPDLHALDSTRDTCEPLLKRMVEAGMNMVRVTGTCVYESNAFYKLCDELGILVWQDFMFANFDYPNDEPFIKSVQQEAQQFLTRIQASPSMAIFCGGSEVYQQGAMMGLPEKLWKNTIFDQILPELCQHKIYVPNSPSGGDLPFSTNAGVSHYYGVGAYLRPLDDARRAEVKFTSECLGFANVPEAATLDAQPVADWKAAVPRDAGTDWDFEDVREHYTRALFNADSERNLNLARATSAHVMSVTMAEWRRCGSQTQGALVWFLKDFLVGAGWGIIDATGERKSCFYALKNVLQPVQILLSDEGLNGIFVHLINETAQSITGTVRLTCLRDGAVPVVSGELVLIIPPRSKRALTATELFGAFFDTTYAYKFGLPSHDCVVAELIDELGECLSDYVYFPLGFGEPCADLQLDISLLKNEDWYLTIKTNCLAQFVHVEDADYYVERNWFHLTPNRQMKIKLTPRPNAQKKPSGKVHIINSLQVFAY